MTGATMLKAEGDYAGAACGGHLQVIEIALGVGETWSAIFNRPVKPRPAFFMKRLLPVHLILLGQVAAAFLVSLPHFFRIAFLYPLPDFLLERQVFLAELYVHDLPLFNDVCFNDLG